MKRRRVQASLVLRGFERADWQNERVREKKLCVSLSLSPSLNPPSEFCLNFGFNFYKFQILNPPLPFLLEATTYLSVSQCTCASPTLNQKL